MIKVLDRFRGFVYKRVLDLALVSMVTALAALPARAFGAEYVLGVPMPKRASSVDRNRFVVPESRLNLKDAVKFFKKKLKRTSVEIVEAIEHPKVKVVHIRSLSATPWEGINLSQRHDRIYIYVIPRGRTGAGEKRAE